MVASSQTGENAYDLQFQLFDVFGRRQLVGYRMPASRGTMRVAAHRAADMIYEKLTGIKGVFGTQVAYVTAQQQGQQRLYSLIVSDQDGENEYTIMESNDPIMSPAWSPDSRQLAYVSFEGNRVINIRTDAAHGQSLTRFPANPVSTAHRHSRRMVANWW